MLFSVIFFVAISSFTWPAGGQDIPNPESITAPLFNPNYPVSDVRINSQQPFSDIPDSQLQGSKKSQLTTHYPNRQQYKICGSLTILPLHDFESCGKTINRMATAICRNGRVKRDLLPEEELEFDGKSHWAQDQLQLKRSLYPSQSVQEQWILNELQNVKGKLVKNCCKYSNICQIEFVVEMISDACHPEKNFMHVAKARA